MNKDSLVKRIGVNEIESIRNTVFDSRREISAFLNIKTDLAESIMGNLIIEAVLSGHNSNIFVIDLRNAQAKSLGKACLKYSSGVEHKNKLKIESKILEILNSNGVRCPKLINEGTNREGIPFILMGAVGGAGVDSHVLDIQTSESILDAIQVHESVLLNNLNILKMSDERLDLDREVDFENKLSYFLKHFTPHFKVKNSCSFLNEYLNNPDIIKKTIITDRSVDNIFIGEDNQITMIDFSTVRIGTQFDNWIQFIDDPRAKFSCSKDDLIKMFFIKTYLNEDMINHYYVASIYTNLLQGIFTYRKNPTLSIQYINNANCAFMNFFKKKGVLIDTGH